jgi:Antitoxin VbhA
MNGSADELDADAIAEILYASDLSPQNRRRVYNAVVSSLIDGGTTDRESLLRLIEFAAGRITDDEHKRQVLAAHLGPQ